MKLSKFKSEVQHEELNRSKLKNIVSGGFPDCEDVIWVIGENGVRVAVCAERYQLGSCLGGLPPGHDDD